jgi:hypothetical protein
VPRSPDTGAGLTEEAAQGMTLNEVARKKFSRDNSL